MKNEITVGTLGRCVLVLGMSMGIGTMGGCVNDNGGADDPSAVEATSEALVQGSACTTSPTAATASPNAKQPPNNAIDGNYGTRWESAYANGQFIQVDVGAKVALTGVTLTWETACGKDYNIDTADAANGPWTTVAQVRGNTKSGVNNPVKTTFAKSARFVRMNGLTRCTQYGFSLWEFQVNSTVVACNLDRDGDGFGAQYPFCGACLQGNIGSNNDCNDANATANPNQTGWFFSPMTFPGGGNPSFDWNCDGILEAQGTDGSYYFCTDNAGVKVNDCSQCVYNWVPSDGTDCGKIRCSLDGGNVQVGCH
jgi:F5/8 type C domain